MDGVTLDALGPLPAHSDLGASGMDRWAHCPGSFALSQRERHRTPTIYAATGTVAHTLVEQAVQADVTGGDPIPGLIGSEGVTVNVDGHEVTVDRDMTNGVRVMLDYVRQRSVELRTRPVVERTVFLDSYFPASEPPPVPMFGRCDIAFEAGSLVEIVDFKNGGGVFVEVTDNMQLMYYVAGFLAELWGRVECPWPTRVRITLCQPNARGAAAKIRSQDLTTLDVEMWIDDVLIPAVRACEAPGAPYVTGRWCRFCPVAHACPVLLQSAQDAARVQFDDSQEGATVAARLLLAEQVGLWAEAMKGYGLERIRSGLAVPGWGEVPKRAMRRWTDADTVTQMLAGFDVVDVKLKSPAQVEQLLKRFPDTWKLVDPYVESKSSGTKLARTTADDLSLFSEDLD